MNEKKNPPTGDLPPAPGPDSWSAAEATDWEPDEEKPSDGTVQG